MFVSFTFLIRSLQSRQRCAINHFFLRRAQRDRRKRAKNQPKFSIFIPTRNTNAQLAYRQHFRPPPTASASSDPRTTRRSGCAGHPMCAKKKGATRLSLLVCL